MERECEDRRGGLGKLRKLSAISESECGELLKVRFGE